YLSLTIGSPRNAPCVTNSFVRYTGVPSLPMMYVPLEPNTGHCALGKPGGGLLEPIHGPLVGPLPGAGRVNSTLTRISTLGIASESSFVRSPAKFTSTLSDGSHCSETRPAVYA